MMMMMMLSTKNIKVSCKSLAAKKKLGWKNSGSFSILNPYEHTIT